MKIEVRVPAVGEFDKVEVVEVLVAAGDRVAAEDSLITLESDKASMDVPAPQAGTIEGLAVAVGDQVGEGDLIVTMEIEDASSEAEVVEEEPAPTTEPPPPAPSSVPSPEPSGVSADPVDSVGEGYDTELLVLGSGTSRSLPVCSSLDGDHGI